MLRRLFSPLFVSNPIARATSAKDWANILAKLRLRGGGKSKVFLCQERGATILAKLRFFGGGKQSLGEAVRQIPL